jgi:acetylornithine deacetylase/succinyl-diaminopimelate desuccinylase-like protein
MVRLLKKISGDYQPRLDQKSRGALRSTLSVGIIQGGTNTNAVPSACRVEIDRRLLPEETIEGAVAELDSFLGELDEPAETWSVRLLTGTKGFASPPDAPCIAAFHKAIRDITGQDIRDVAAIGASDARYFADDHIVAMTFGPGHAKDGHKANEFVPLDELEKAAKIQLAVIEDMLGFTNAGRS